MMTGLTELTKKNIQLNAGVCMVDFAVSGYTGVDALETALLEALEAGTNTVGATRGGGSFEVTPTYRDIEADGKRGPVVGMTQLDEVIAKLTGTMIEVTAANLERVLATADTTVSGRKTSIKMRNKLKETDYIPNFVWVGDTSEGFLLIALKNVLNKSGLKLNITDKGEGTMPFEFTAHADGLSDTEYAPFEIIKLDGGAVASYLAVYSVEGATSGKTLITVTPQKTEAQSYKYKTGSTVNVPAAADVLTTGWTDWDGSAEITATTGQLIVVAVVTAADNKCVSAGRTTVVSKA